MNADIDPAVILVAFIFVALIMIPHSNEYERRD
jgi:preprotein translocase subunit Sec61beta